MNWNRLWRTGKTPLAIILMASVVLWGAACTPEEAQALQGIVQSINQVDGKVTIVTKDGKTVVIDIDSKTKVETANFTSVLEALEPGTSIRIKVEKDRPNVAESINARLAKVKGTIAAVAGNQVTVQPDRGGQQVKVVVTANTSIKIKGDAPGSMSDLKVGVRVDVKYDPTSMAAFRIHVGSEEEADVEGTITQLSGDNVTIQTEKGRLVTIILSANTTFEDGTRADLQVGKKIEAKFDPVTLVAIKIELKGGDREGKQEKRNFTAHLSGREEVPPVTTKGQGEAIFHLSDNGTELSFRLNIANTENITQAHIHLGAVGQNGTVVAWLYPAAPPAVTIPGRFDGTLATGVITSAKLVGPLAGQPLSALIDKMRAGEAYVNVHTQKNPGGELRGQIGGESESKGPSEESRRSKIEGTIKAVASIDATSSNVTIEAREGGTLTLLVTTGTKIEVNGSGSGSLSDLKVGVRVQAEFDPATKTAIKIEVKKSGDGAGSSSEGKDKDKEERGRSG